MKNYTITVNGNVYDVTVEESGARTGCSTQDRTEGSSEGSARQLPKQQLRQVQQAASK